jgi:hypothetical protein
MWMGEWEPISWPLRSPDLSLLDLLFGSYVKDKIVLFKACITAKRLSEATAAFTQHIHTVELTWQHLNWMHAEE